MEKHILSKSTFIRGTQCVKSLYLNKKRRFLRDRLSDAQRAVFNRGTDVGLLAQQLFPGGIDLKPRSWNQYAAKAKQTETVIRTGKHQTLYEATFQYDRLLAILDILVKQSEGWMAYEVKSSLKISETYLLDAAFQYYVITHSGVLLQDFFLVYVNPEYERGNDLDVQQLFTKKSVLREVLERQPYIVSQIEKEKQALQTTSSPKVPIGPHCHNPYPCDFLGHCWKKVASDSVLYLNAFDENERFERYYHGEDQPEKIPVSGLTEQQKLQLESAVNKSLARHPEKLQAFVKSLPRPPVFLTSFFVRPAIPVYPGMRPYQLVPVSLRFSQDCTDNAVVKFFSGPDSPLSSFDTYFKNLLAKFPQMVVYDKHRLFNYFKERGNSSMIKQMEKQIVDLHDVFTGNMLYDYRLRGDDSPEKAAEIFLNRLAKQLNSSLLQLSWAQKLIRGETGGFDELTEKTKKHLDSLADFEQQFYNFLKIST